MTELFRPVEGIELDSLGTVISDDSTHFPVPEQFGPLRYYEKTLRCASRNCSSPTHYKVKGTPYCYPHALNKLNDMLIELGVEK